MRKEHNFTAIKVSLVVGTILNLVNNFELFQKGPYEIKSVFKVLFTYAVPFLVSIYSSWKTSK